MPIKTPKERAFYYEITNLRERLIYWIPMEDLEDMVNNGDVCAKILKDYPFGLDIEVYQGKFDEFEKQYDLKIPIDLNDTLKAFQAVKAQYGRKFPRTGLINAEELENLAQNLKSEMEKMSEFRTRDLPIVETREVDKKSFRQQQMLQRKTKSMMKKFKFKGLDTKAPIQEQRLFKVPMTDGEDAIDALSRLHQYKIKRK